MKIFVSTHPFSSTSPLPMKLIQENGMKLSVNEHGRKITTQELSQDIKDAEVLVAGTEKITEEVSVVVYLVTLLMVMMLLSSTTVQRSL
jgi:D-3-phosphoglycerate dehydrogenase